jgi:plastocyanin
MAAATLVMASGALAGHGSVLVTDDKFDEANWEAGLNGAVVSWDWAKHLDHKHNVRQDTRLFFSGAPTKSPAESLGSFELPAGKYHYYCEVHGSKNGGMDGNIEITPSADTPSPDFNPITWALDSSIRVGDRWEVQYKVGQGKWKTWKKNTADLGGNFGENDKPVNFSQLKVYKVRVKTKLAAHPDRQSKFSPPVFFPEN